MRSNARWISIVQICRHDELYVRLLHLAKLRFGHAFLQGQEMLYFNSISFLANLTPTIFAGCFCREHSQFSVWEALVLVRCLGWKEEVRSLVHLDKRPMREVRTGLQSFLDHQVAHMVFERIARAR